MTYFGQKRLEQKLPKSGSRNNAVLDYIPHSNSNSYIFGSRSWVKFVSYPESASILSLYHRPLEILYRFEGRNRAIYDMKSNILSVSIYLHIYILITICLRRYYLPCAPYFHIEPFIGLN